MSGFSLLRESTLKLSPNDANLLDFRSKSEILFYVYVLMQRDTNHLTVPSTLKIQVGSSPNGTPKAGEVGLNLGGGEISTYK